MSNVYKDLIKELEIADINNDKTFQYLTNKVFGMIYVDKRKFAAEFGLALSTIERYKEGITAPHPTLRKRMFVYYTKLIKEYFNVS